VQDVPTAGRSIPTYDSRKIQGSRPWLGLLVFLVLAALLIAPQTGAFPATVKIYESGRYAVAGVAFFMVLMEAFRFGAFSGFLCLLVPFYAVFYAATRIESHWRKGIFFAVLAMFAGEMYFMRDRAMLTQLGDWANGRIDAIGQGIQRAGDAPME
jgi:hypothetical protein